MRLTPEQQQMVEENMSVVDWAIFLYVDIYQGVPCLERDDLMQTGYLALCEAALSHDGQRAKFRTYAEVVVRNRLMDYCRKNSVSTVSLDAPVGGQETFHDLLPSGYADDDSITSLEDRDVLERCYQKMHGVARVGMRAMLLQVRGYTGTELAQRYGIPPNHLTAWASKARHQLRRAHVREQFYA